MHKCVCIWWYILQNYNYKLHFQNLSIYHIPHVSIRTLAVENLDVCTAYDPWDSNIPWEYTGDGKYTLMLFNVWPWLLLIVITNAIQIGNWWWCKTNGQSVPEGDMMMRGVNTHLPTLFPMMISASMTHWPNLLIINLVPLHNPIDWLKLHNKRISTPTLSSNLWFTILLNCKMFRNSTKYNESIKTHVTTVAPFFVKAKESMLRYVCNYLNNNSRIALLTSSTLIFLGAKMLRCIRYMASPEWRWWFG